MSLAPLEVSPKPEGGEEGASFKERALQRLQSEQEPEPGQPQDLAESAEDVEPELDESNLDEGYDAAADDDEETESDEVLDDESEVEDDESEEETVEGLKAEKLRLEQKISQITENRKKIESDLTDSISENITFKHKLDDSVNAVQASAGVFLTLANQKVERFNNMDWSKVPADKVNDYRAAAQKAVNERDQLFQTIKQVMDNANGQRETAKKREAEISRDILKRRIPNWGDEVYSQIAKHAVEKHHFSAEEFGNLTDWRVVELLHKSMENEQAVEKVQKIERKRKAKAPRNRHGRPAPRNAKGRANQSRENAHANPGDRSATRQFFMDKLAAERGERR